VERVSVSEQSKQDVARPDEEEPGSAVTDEARPHEAAADPVPREPAYTIAIGEWSSLSLTAYSTVLFFLAWGLISALTRGAGGSMGRTPGPRL
jgi:hypothetical protein